MPETDPKKLRDYGRPDSVPIGAPWVSREVEEPHEACPNCGCRTLYEIHVQVQQQLVVGGLGMGIYIGCPACPWASPMMVHRL